MVAVRNKEKQEREGTEVEGRDVDKDYVRKDRETYNRRENMSGHSKWSQIKHKKGITDKKKGALFSKLLNTVTIAAKKGEDPDFNPTLRTAIEKAKEANIPQDKIRNAVTRVANKNVEELLIEVYGAGGVAIIIQAISDSKNRTIAEIKKILSDNEARLANPGSVIWSFDAPTQNQNEWRPKFSQEVSNEIREKTRELLETLENNEEVAAIYTNIQ